MVKKHRLRQLSFTGVHISLTHAPMSQRQTQWSPFCTIMMHIAVWTIVLVLNSVGGANSSEVPPTLISGAEAVGAGARLTSCFLDGLWYGVASDGSTVTVGIQSQLGPPGSTIIETTAPGARHRRAVPSPRGFSAIPGAAIACVPGEGCLRDESGTHGCIHVFSNQSGEECVWTHGADAAADACARWDACGGFWCGSTNETIGSNASWCWARSVHATVSYTSPDAFDTAYVKAPTIPPLEPGTTDLVGASCQSPGCTWTFATGAWFEDGTFNLSRSDDVVDTGTVLDKCNTIIWTSENDVQVWTKLNANVSKVHIVFMAHYDAGYTYPTVQANLEDYANNFFPLAFNTSETLRKRGGEEQFQWTSQAWLISALLRNQSGASSPEFVAQLEAAIARGDVRWTANPMNMQEECGEVNHMAFGHGLAHDLDARFNKTEPRIAASQKDVPGFTLGAVKLFADKGIKLLHVGANDFSTTPAFPTLSAPYHSYCNQGFLSDSMLKKGSELLLLYCSGYSGPFNLGMQLPNMMTIIPGFDEALVYLMHIDNHAPQTAEEVLAGWKATQRLYPNAVLQSSSMDAWATALLKSRERGDVPETAIPMVKDLEMGDTWIYGLSSDPTKMRNYRATTREFNAIVAEGVVNLNASDVKLFQEILLKVPEHTWGYNGYGGCNYLAWDNQGWHVCNLSVQCCFGGPTYMMARNSYIDQRNFIGYAIEALDNTTHSFVKNRLYAAISSREPSVELPSPSAGWTPVSVTNLTAKLSMGGVDATLVFNTSGAITGLVIGGRVLCNAEEMGSHFLGLLVYRTHSEYDLNDFGDAYALRDCNFDCGRCAFSKCNMGGDTTTNVAIVDEAFSRTINASHREFLFNVAFSKDANFLAQYGAPPLASIHVTIDASRLAESVLVVSHDVQWFNKPPTKMAESIWFAFSPSTDNLTSGWQMDKLGRWIDPMSVATNGSTSMHAVWSGVRKLAANGNVLVNIESPDTPVVSPNLDFLPTGAFGVPARPNEGWSWNLFNNAWNTNYPLWSLDEAERFQFRTTLAAKNATSPTVTDI